MSELVAITGLGITCALGADRATVSAACRRGDRPFAPVRRFDASAFKVDLAAEAPDLDVRGRFGARARHTSRTDRLALWAAADALEQAGIDASHPLRAQMAVLVGASSGGMEEMEREVLRDASPRGAPFDVLWAHPVWATARSLSRALGLGGPRATYMTACSSAAHALGIAMHRLRKGELSVALAGGAESLCRLTLAGFGSLGVLDPEGTRPFAAARRGITLGEGSAFFVLERLEHARARGARVLAILAGYGSSADAHHMVHPHAQGRGARAAMEAALADAELTASDVDYVNAHGTGTVQNDAMEALAVAQLAGERALRVASSKGMLGHTLGACAAVEAALVVLGMLDGFCPPNAGEHEAMPLGSLRLVRPGDTGAPRVALSTSFAFGGNNAALVITGEPTPRTRARSVASERAVVTGAAVSCPRGTASLAAEIWSLLEQDAPLPGHALAGLDPAGVLGARAIRRLDPLSAAVTALATLALRSAELAPAPDVGVSFGTSFGALDETAKFLARLADKGPALVNPLDFPNLVHNAPAGHASIALGAAGASVTACQEELSGDEAVRTMVGRLRRGSLRRAVCAGGDLHWTPLNDAYRRLARVVDVAHDHASVVAALVLESTQSARERGARPWAEIAASTSAGPSEGLLGALASARAAHAAPPALWLTSGLSAYQHALENAAAASWLSDVPRVNARARLGNAGGAGVAAIACAAAAIHLGRYPSVLVTSLTHDGCGHVTLLRAWEP